MSEVSLYIVYVYLTNPGPSVVSVTVSFVNLLAIFVTSLRLYHRYNISRLWWDDCIAAVAGIMDGVALINLWVGDDEPSEAINIQIIPVFFLIYKLLGNSFAELIVFKVGFLSIVAVEWFVFMYFSIMASSLIQMLFFLTT